MINGHARAYTPEKTASYENLIAVEWRRQTHDFAFQAGIPLAIEITAHMSPPRSASRKIRESMLANILRPMKKPDWDNVAKAVCDALNGIAYHDDAQIVFGSVVKVWGDRPRLEIKIAEVSHD